MAVECCINLTEMNRQNRLLEVYSLGLGRYGERNEHV
jgi:hypothetical protein